MTTDRIRAAFIGLNPAGQWASTAHIPALRTLQDRFEIVGVANTNVDSARRSAQAFGLPHAFQDVGALVRSDEVDLVIVTVKVPHHFSLVSQALEAGKHVFCEWPLGNGLAEAETLADLADRKGVVAVVGTQARVAPEIIHLRQLIAEGFVGKVLSTTIVADAGAWSDQTSEDLAYLNDAANGATMLSIPMGHTLAALRDVLGEIGDIDARFITHRPRVVIAETGKAFTRSAPEEVIVMGVLKAGAGLVVHFRGGMSRGTNFLWEINGTEGDIQVTGANGHAQMVQLLVRGARGDERELRLLMPGPEVYAGLADTSVVRNVAGVYARLADDISTGSRSAPSFRDAVALHEVIDRIEMAAKCR